MKHYDDCPAWVRITNNEADRPPIHFVAGCGKTKYSQDGKERKHIVREIIYTFDELLGNGDKTGMVFEFDDPVIAADEMGINSKLLKDLPYRMGHIETIGDSRYLMTAKITDRVVSDATHLVHDNMEQGVLFND